MEIEIKEKTEIKEPKPAPTNYPIHDLIMHRWSPRMFSDKPVGNEKMRILLEAARWAPSSMNEQPWRFIYTFKGKRGYDRIYDCLSDFNQKWVHNAPVLMLAAYKEKFDSGKDNFHALHDLGLAVGNMTVQATSMGIALHNMAGVDWKKAHEVFNVPQGYHVSSAIALGYYGGENAALSDDLEEKESKSRSRKTQDEIASEGEWSFS